MKKLFVLFLLLSSSNAYAINLSQALGKYCIPPETMCKERNSVFEAKYNSGKTDIKERCTCSDKKYMYYSEDERKCKIQCPAGYYVKEVSGNSCGAGRFKYTITRTGY